jgi:hypothetical protein
MTTVLTRISEIKNKEGFDVWNIRRNSRLVRVTRSGVLRAWPHRNRTKDTHSVQEFRDKFSAVNPGYTCDVLDGNGNVAHGNTKLKQVLATY